MQKKYCDKGIYFESFDFNFVRNIRREQGTPSMNENGSEGKPINGYFHVKTKTKRKVNSKEKANAKAKAMTVDSTHDEFVRSIYGEDDEPL